MASTTASRKAKARRLQNAVRDAVLELFPGLTENDVWSQPMGVNGMDIGLSQSARDRLGLAIECKAREALNIWSALEQAEQNADGLTPAVVFKRNRSDCYVAMRFEDFLAILREARDGNVRA